jgi:hypothetical protein
MAISLEDGAMGAQVAATRMGWAPEIVGLLALSRRGGQLFRTPLHPFR